MKGYIKFLRDHPKSALFGVVLTFTSSFGQTFLISLYVPSILEEFELTATAFGSMYAIATVVASFLLIRFGPGIDRKKVKTFTGRAALLLGVSSLLFALSFHEASLVLALIGLRFAGQGLMSHISMTVMARSFTRDRGKAISVSTLGYSIGEMIFPALLAFAMGLIGWRWVAGLSVVAVAVIMIPILYKLPLHRFDPEVFERKQSSKELGAFFLRQMKLLKFWVLAPTSLALSFLSTGFFFYQLLLAEDKGWTIKWYTTAFAAYAISRFVFSLYGGMLTDRFSAIRIFPYHMIPLLFGFVGIAYFEGDWVAPFYLILTGVTMGSRGTIKNAVFAELYDVDKIGTIRSLFTMIMVISTATGPMVFGYLLDNGFSFEQIAEVSWMAMAVVIANSFLIFRFQR
ncbi:MAG: MFS transporter [Flavobacteriales bacterium]|nr:MFS transporter [Flavobacteriales bacterium]